MSARPKHDIDPPVDSEWIRLKDDFVERLRHYRPPLTQLEEQEIAERSRRLIEEVTISMEGYGLKPESADAEALRRVCEVLISAFGTDLGFSLYHAAFVRLIDATDTPRPPKRTTGKQIPIRDSIETLKERGLARQTKWLPVLKRLGLTRSKWASEAGVSPSIVYDYLSGTTVEMHRDSRVQLADILGVHESALAD